MKVIIFATFLVVCRGAKLDNTYLPPENAQSSGGDFGSGLAPPNQGNNNNNNNNNFGQPQNGFGQNPQQQGGGPGGFQPQESQQPPIAIISYDNEPNYGDGSYKYSYETENGIKAQEQGEVKNKGTDNEIQSVRGSYSYTGPDGVLYEVTYIADENGFQPMGAHIPTPSPAVQQAIAAQQAAAAQNGNGNGNGNNGNGNGNGNFNGNGNGNGNNGNGNGFNQQPANDFAPNGNGNGNGYNYQPPNPPANDFPSSNNNGYPSGRPQNDYQPQFDAPQQQPQQPSRPNNQYIPPSQNRPNGSGNGNFNPQTGYRY